MITLQHQWPLGTSDGEGRLPRVGPLNPVLVNENVVDDLLEATFAIFSPLASNRGALKRCQVQWPGFLMLISGG